MCSTLAIWLNYFFGFFFFFSVSHLRRRPDPLSLRWCVYLIRLVMWWASFSYLCLQGTSFGELEKTRAPSSVFKYKRNIQNCSTMEYHRWLVDDFFPFRCGPHPTTTNKIHVKIERKTGYENVISLEFSYISFCGQFYPICDACIHTPTREREREQSSFIYIYCTVHTIVFISHLSLYLSTLC